ncbi:dehydrogenase [Streptomyces avermitilis]|uniref:Dehydrogenase n=2 Tax=Streptomyces avermitilis TaxID=33903 RepID=Q82Q15_STRAW|nr:MULTISPECIES: zinc-binding dehydrogenase [Streptomyces]KUN50643.1 dehydrogenase [Streptomyces avermitilis]MYS96365.1 zinc-binding dehydrogenase [Streptomyces sp. SID5469]OOV21786.1 dehydrogenase [Streptomyces avermitilis]BAC68416.1 putative dehydrogenase [Streptomyces avermitilis MA-4680 = NBRC 14893]BBJ48260.1 zinc-binding dehydrogenase [Streptomyces avermitilis]
MNRRVVYTRGGSPANVLTVIEEPEPAPGSGQVLIRTTAFPVHPGDLQAVEAYPEEATKPVPAGVEATGVVEAIGPGTRVAPGVTVGGRVTVFPQPGAWSQWIVADADALVAVPDELSDEVAAQMLVNPLTTVMLRREAQEHPAFGYDGLLVQTAAGSSVGRLLTGASLVHNLALVNVVRSDRGAAELRKRFPDVPVVATEHPGWADEVREAAGGRPVSVALDPIGGKLAESLLDLLTPGGKLVSYGQIGEEPISVHASTLLHKSLTLRGKNIGRWLSEASADRRASDVATAKLIALTLKDQFDVAATYGLDELGNAVEHAVRPGKIGTVLVRPW